jgi:methylenetetrahydrofolate reductase (NADPH)
MPAPSKFAEGLKSGAFLVTCELDPPKGIDPSIPGDKIKALREKTQALVVSDNHNARMHMAPLGFCRYLLDQGLDPVMTMTCRDRNRLALQSDLLAAAGLGIQNILVVTGDYMTWGDHPESKPVYDLDAVQLLWTLSQLNSNRDISGNPLEGPAPSFTFGAAVSLAANPVLPEILKFRKKEGAGAHFFMSQPIFELADVEEFFKQTPELKSPLLASVCLLKEEQIRDYGPGKFPGLTIPGGLWENWQSLKPGEIRPKMMEHTAKLIEAIKKDGRFRGVHLMLNGEEEMIGELI